MASTRSRIVEYGQVINLISQNDIPGLHRLVSTATKEKVGVSELINRLEKAKRGEYHPKNYTPCNFDLAMLMYELGGAGAVYALNHAPTALPSLKRIRALRKKFSLRLTVRHIELSDILKNIETVCGPNSGLPTPREIIGHSLAIDEIAGDGRLCYLPETDEIAGFCREHVGYLKTVKMGEDMTAVHDAAKAVQDDKVHIAKEFTVMAVTRHAATSYDAKPIVLSPTCKKSTWKDSVRVISTVLQAWKISPYGEVLNGPMWAISSDGDATRRAGMYLLCMHKEVTPNDPLFPYINCLNGLNLHTGENYLTMDFDYKHIFKRTFFIYLQSPFT